MIVVDASVLLSRLLSDEIHHVPSREWLDAYLLRGGDVAAPFLLLAEVAGGVARRAGTSDLADLAIDELSNLPNMHFVAVDLELANIAAHLASALRLRGADATYVATAYRYSVPLFTWDREQRERSHGLIEAYEPGAGRS